MAAVAVAVAVVGDRWATRNALLIGEGGEGQGRQRRQRGSGIGDGGSLCLIDRTVTMIGVVVGLLLGALIGALLDSGAYGVYMRRA